jgi:hypothetical protein
MWLVIGIRRWVPVWLGSAVHLPDRCGRPRHRGTRGAKGSPIRGNNLWGEKGLV